MDFLRPQLWSGICIVPRIGQPRVHAIDLAGAGRAGISRLKAWQSDGGWRQRSVNEEEEGDGWESKTLAP